jgi:hypothetical protein
MVRVRAQTNTHGQCVDRVIDIAEDTNNGKGLGYFSVSMGHANHQICNKYIT